MKIESLDRSVEQVLSTGYYRIPRFQRPYSWTLENLEEFWTDTIVDSGGDYFIGAVIVFATASNRFDVVDGQQRFTTLTIMLAALRDCYDKNALPKLAQGLHAFVERPNVSNDPEFVLQTETSYPYLHEHIQKHGPPDSGTGDTGPEEEALQAARRFFGLKLDAIVRTVVDDPRVKPASRQERIERELTGVRDKVLQLKLILVTVDDEDNAYIIFETLNSRGLNLRVSDLMKNHLFRHLKKKNAKVDVPKVKWESILDLFEKSSASISLDSYLHHQWLSNHDYVSGTKLFRKIKAEIGKAEASTYLDSLVADARRYRTIHEPEWLAWPSGHSGLRESLEALNVFNVDQPKPFVLAVLRALDEKKIKVALARRALQAVENYHFIFTAVTGTSSSGGITKMYALHARELTGAADASAAAATVDRLIKKLTIPSLDVFKASFVELGYSSSKSKQKKLIKYVLTKYYRHHSDGVAPDFDQMTIEHLAPESGHTAADVGDREIACIGNLILVDEALNNKLANKGFDEKKKVLAAKNQVWIDPTVLTATKWDKAAIDARAEQMAKLAYSTLWKTAGAVSA